MPLSGRLVELIARELYEIGLDPGRASAIATDIAKLNAASRRSGERLGFDDGPDAFARLLAICRHDAQSG